MDLTITFGESKNKTTSLGGVISCTKIDALPKNSAIDYGFIHDSKAKYNIYKIKIGGATKYLAVQGKLEVFEIPVTRNKIDEWES